MRISRGDVHLFTYKEGVLSRIAHDLRLSVRRFRVTVDGSNVRGDFFPETIQVDGAMRDGELQDKDLSARDIEKIRTTMAGSVLKVSQYARISFEGVLRPQGGDGNFVARGKLTLVGKSVEIAVPVRLADGRATGELEFTPSEWGIKPYSALGGTLKLQDRVGVAFDVEVPDA